MQTISNLTPSLDALVVRAASIASSIDRRKGDHDLQNIRHEAQLQSIFKAVENLTDENTYRKFINAVIDAELVERNEPA
jgi:hypothetical protein